MLEPRPAFSLLCCMGVPERIVFVGFPFGPPRFRVIRSRHYAPPTMPALLRFLLALSLLTFAAFCAFGFLASFEPSASPRWPGQVGYAVLGVAGLTGAIRLLRPKRQRSTDAPR